MTTKTINGTWNYPTRILFGPGRIKELPENCKKFGMKRPLLVTDAGLKSHEIVARTLDLLKAAGIEPAVFADIKPNPTGKNIDDGVKAYKDGMHDGVIAFGGGSGLDAAKAIALMVGQDRPLWDFIDEGDNYLRVNEAGMAPVIAIPTTSGTGSEVGRCSVVVNEETHKKELIFHPKILPGLVIADPELTTGLPPSITAATGIDAFVHCFEAFCAPGFHPQADGIALEGMKLVADYLPRAYKDGSDIEARAHMLVAATMGAAAFQKGLGGVHALAHPLGGNYDKPHGLLNAILLPYVMERNREAIADKMEHLSRVLNLQERGYNAAGFDAVLKWILDFRKTLGIPNTLAEIGVPSDNIEKIGMLATQDPSAGGNPIQLTPQDYTDILAAALKGSLAEKKQAA